MDTRHLPIFLPTPARLEEALDARPQGKLSDEAREALRRRLHALNLLTPSLLSPLLGERLDIRDVEAWREGKRPLPEAHIPTLAALSALIDEGHSAAGVSAHAVTVWVGFKQELGVAVKAIGEEARYTSLGVRGHLRGYEISGWRQLLARQRYKPEAGARRASSRTLVLAPANLDGGVKEARLLDDVEEGAGEVEGIFHVAERHEDYFAAEDRFKVSPRALVFPHPSTFY